jgi:hypothetical protein
MILSLAGKYQKAIARFLAGIIYIQLVLPLAARAEAPRFYFPKESFRTGFTDKQSGNATNADKSFSNSFKRDYIPVNSAVNKLITNSSNHADRLPAKFEKTDIGGPGQPEMSSFQSVNGGNMVDMFTGDFSYNIPLMDVGGYPVNIHYTGGIRKQVG